MGNPNGRGRAAQTKAVDLLAVSRPKSISKVEPKVGRKEALRKNTFKNLRPESDKVDSLFAHPGGISRSSPAQYAKLPKRFDSETRALWVDKDGVIQMSSKLSDEAKSAMLMSTALEITLDFKTYTDPVKRGGHFRTIQALRKNLELLQNKIRHVVVKLSFPSLADLQMENHYYPSGHYYHQVVVLTEMLKTYGGLEDVSIVLHMEEPNEADVSFLVPFCKIENASLKADFSLASGVVQMPGDWKAWVLEQWERKQARRAPAGGRKGGSNTRVHRERAQMGSTQQKLREAKARGTVIVR